MGENEMAQRMDIRHVRTHTKASFETVADYYGLELERSGSDENQRKALCPFHDDHDPSLSINLEKGIFQCWVCGAKGNLLDFVMQMEEISNPREGAFKLAEICGITDLVPNGSKQKSNPKRLSPKERLAARANGSSGTPTEVEEPDSTAVAAESETSPKERVSKPADDAFKPFTRKLELDPQHPYLKERGLSDETIERFELGYCSSGYMKGRIAIRIYDAEGNPLGYAGRWAEAKPPDDKPRYLLPKKFPKEHVLFNANRIGAVDSIILVESYWSVFHLDALNYAAVGSMGWAVSPHHIAILMNLGVKRIDILFDGDEAGRKGTLAAVEALVPHFDVRAPSTTDGFKPHRAAPETLNELLDH